MLENGTAGCSCLPPCRPLNRAGPPPPLPASAPPSELMCARSGRLLVAGGTALYPCFASPAQQSLLRTPARLQNLSLARELYARAVDKAPTEQQALAPWLALQWLRVCLAASAVDGWLGPLALARLAAGWRAVVPRAAWEAAAAAAGGEGKAAGLWAGSGTGPLQRVAAAASGWDALVMALLVCALTWVLWRKRQVRRGRQQPTGSAAQQGGGSAPGSPQQPSAPQQANGAPAPAPAAAD